MQRVAPRVVVVWWYRGDVEGLGGLSVGLAVGSRGEGDRQTGGSLPAPGEASEGFDLLQFHGKSIDHGLDWPGSHLRGDGGRLRQWAGCGVAAPVSGRRCRVLCGYLAVQREGVGLVPVDGEVAFGHLGEPVSVGLDGLF
jgi:hypothetical protein